MHSLSFYQINADYNDMKLLSFIISLTINFCVSRFFTIFYLFQGENKVALRNLSIVMRQKASDLPEDRLRNIEAGLTRAREVNYMISIFL